MAGGMELQFFGLWIFKFRSLKFGKNRSFCGISGIFPKNSASEKYFSDSGKWPFHTPPIHTPTKCRPKQSQNMTGNDNVSGPLRLRVHLWSRTRLKIAGRRSLYHIVCFTLVLKKSCHGLPCNEISMILRNINFATRATTYRSLRALRGWNPKESPGGSAKKSPKIPEKLFKKKLTNKVWGILNFFLLGYFWRLYCRRPKKTPKRLFGISGPERPETPVNGRS